MHKALFRQLRRSLGVADEAALARLLANARNAADACPPEVRTLLAGFSGLLDNLDTAFRQYDRDIELASRSQDLSSNELFAANERLRQEALGRERALKAVQKTVSGLLPGVMVGETSASDDLEALTLLLAELVRERERGRRALDD